MVTLEMPDGVMNGNIVEGSSYDINVVANRAVSEDTEVMISRDRAGSDAGDDDFSVGSATIMAGEYSATAELMATKTTCRTAAPRAPWVRCWCCSGGSTASRPTR